MNYRLSCATERTLGKNGYLVEVNGKTLSAKVFKFDGSNIKDNILESIYRGLKDVRQYVKHEDILYIEVQNTHLCEWLSGLVEYKGYEKHLDLVFAVLESIDCRYKFVYVKKPYARAYIQHNDISAEEMSSLHSLIDEFK